MLQLKEPLLEADVERIKNMDDAGKKTRKEFPDLDDEDTLKGNRIWMRGSGSTSGGGTSYNNLGTGLQQNRKPTPPPFQLRELSAPEEGVG